MHSFLTGEDPRQYIFPIYPEFRWARTPVHYIDVMTSRQGVRFAC
jgi:hypothetical protein